MIRVNVTQRDITRARRRHDVDGSTCPVARALHRHRGWRACRVGSSGFVFAAHTTAVFDPLPAEVKAFIRHFDAGVPVRPFTFEIPA